MSNRVWSPRRIGFLIRTADPIDPSNRPGNLGPFGPGFPGSLLRLRSVAQWFGASGF